MLQEVDGQFVSTGTDYDYNDYIEIPANTKKVIQIFVDQLWMKHHNIDATDYSELLLIKTSQTCRYGDYSDPIRIPIV